MYMRGSVADNEELFAADARIKAMHGYGVVDIRTEGKALVVTYQLVPAGPRVPN